MDPQKVFIYPHPVLLEKCKEFPKDQDPKEIVEKLQATLSNISTGVGLAAPQIGIPYRIFLGPENKVFINPEIQLKGSTDMGTEGCLSIPGIYAKVERNRKVKVKWFDENWEEHEQQFRGFEGVIVQHEFDHIDGINFVDKLNEVELAKVIRPLNDLKKGLINTPKYEFQLKED